MAAFGVPVVPDVVSRIALVSNAANFILAGDAIISAYGFTIEPDYLYVIHRHSGKTLKRLKLKSGATHLILKDSKLYVRTYNQDYVFTLQGR